MLAAIAAVAAPANLGACAADRDDAVQVAVVWSGDELDRFREVVAGFEADNPGVVVDVVSAGDDIDGFLRARSRAGTLPDVAVLPQPGLIDDYAERGWLEPLDRSLTDRYEPFWQGLGQVGDDLYGVAVKASFKSLLWYRPDEVDASDLASWNALPALVDTRAGADGPALLAVGAANGWVLTDWLENMLLARDSAPPTLYPRLAAGEPAWCDPLVEKALVDLAGLWSVDGAFPGSGRRALLTEFDESVVQVAGSGEATLLLGGDFVESIAGRVLADADATQGVRWARLPSPTGRAPALLGGDYAVVIDDRRAGRGPADDSAHAFVEWITRPGSFRPWIDHGGYYSPLKADGTAYPDALAADLAGLVRAPPVGAGFDLSDRIDRGVGARIEEAMRTFFGDVAASGRPATTARVQSAVTRATSSLNQAVGGDGCGG